MHAAWVAGGLAVVAALAPGSPAEPPPYESIVTAAVVEVRSGPSRNFYPTSLLRQGDRVRVRGSEENGAWLAIDPPPGSFSWIQDRALGEHRGRQAFVLLDDTPIRVGSELVETPPLVERRKLSRGTQVVILDTRMARDENGGWLPISPVPSEVRYIPADAVRPAAPVQTTAAAPPAAPVPGVTAAAGPVEVRWRQAEAARLAGRYAEAEQLYLQVAAETADRDLQVRCYNEVQFLRQRAAAPPATPSLSPPTSAAGAPPGYWPSGAPAVPPAPAQATSQYTYSRDSTWQRPGTAPAGTSNSGPGAQWIGAGWLRPAGFVLDNRETFVLESPHGYTYVTPQPGATLAPYLGKHVFLYGNVGYRGDVRTNYMVATHVALAR